MRTSGTGFVNVFDDTSLIFIVENIEKKRFGGSAKVRSLSVALACWHVVDGRLSAGSSTPAFKRAGARVPMFWNFDFFSADLQTYSRTVWATAIKLRHGNPRGEGRVLRRQRTATSHAKRRDPLNSIFNWKEPRPLGLDANAPPSCLRIVAVLPVHSAGVAMAIMVRQRHLSNMF